MRHLTCGDALRIAARVVFFIALTVAQVRAAYADDFQDKVDAALAAPRPEDTVSALEQEAYRGNLKAAYQLALLLRDGKLVPRDDAAAYERFEEAATPNLIRAQYKRGLAEAQHEVGVMLRDGIGAERDVEEAAEWFERAAEQGHGASQLALAALYLHGLGVDEDYGLAYFWAGVAARSDHETRERAARVRTRAVRRLEPAEQRALNRKISAWSAEQG